MLKSNGVQRHRLNQQLADLQTLVRLQRSVRLGLRALWLGAGGIMLGWGIHHIWGVLESQVAWIAIGLALAAWPLLMLVTSFSAQARWVRNLDVRLGLQEQVSTAWEVVKDKQRTLVSNLLVRDAIELLPRLQQRVLRRGWYLEIDILAALIVFLLAVMLLVSNFIRPYRDQLGGPPVANIPQVLPPPLVPQEQSQQDQQAGANSGENSGGESGQQGGEQNGQSQSGAGDQAGQGQGQPGNDPGAGAAADALRQLGQDLSRQAGTYDLGQKLEDLDLNGAAEALEDLQDNLDELSPESRDNLEQALRKAAENMNQAGKADAAQNMQQAAQALEDQNDDAAGEAMGEMADNLRQMAPQVAGQAETTGSGQGTGEGQSAGTGGPEPLARLQDEGGELNLPSGDATDSGLLNPSDPNASGEGTASGAQDSTLQPQDETTVQSPLLPSSFLWKWRDVVSQYFQR